MNTSLESDLIAQHRGYCVYLSTYYARRFPHVDMDDLLQVAAHEIIVRARTWRNDGTAAFLTYARPWLVRALATHCWHTMPGMKIVRPRGLQQIKLRVVSLDEPLNEEGRTRADLLEAPADETGADNDMRDHLLALLRTFGERERTVLSLRHEEQLSFSQIGERLGLTRERARQIHHAALARLRKRYRAASIKRHSPLPR